MESDVIFIGLLPAIARSILPELTFSKDKFVISMMAAVNFDEVGILRIYSPIVSFDLRV